MGELLPYLILALAAFYWYNKSTSSRKVVEQNYQNKEAEFLKTIEEFVSSHKRVLAIQRRQLIKLDPYGKEVHTLWEKEMSYFIEHHITPKFGLGLFFIWHEEKLAKFKRIIERVAKKEEAIINDEASISGYHEQMTGIEFETFCQLQLQLLGWDTVITKKSGDQGVDLIAAKESRRMAVQCKKYTGTVGNKAVQEVVAGIRFYGTDFGIVISNSSFTSSAKQLAKANKVLLLHFKELDNV